MNAPNPFLPPQAKAKTRPSGLSQKDGDMIARVMAKQMHDVVAPLEKRIAQLETALAYAQEQASDNMNKELTRFTTRRTTGDE